MSQWYGERDDEQSIGAINAAIDVGIDFFDTSDAYGPFLNEELLGRALAGHRHECTIGTKVGIIWEQGTRRLDGSPKHIARAARESLSRLRTECIDLYYLHRVDPVVPIEDSVGAIAQLVDEGLVRYAGLCEASSQLIERAHRVHPITAVQSEYSLWTRDPEADVLPTTTRLGIGFVPYSPLGRGLSTGTIRSADDLGAEDARRVRFPRFAPDNLAANSRLIDQLDDLRREAGVTAAQLSLAWVLARGKSIVPIPGTKRPRYVRENARAVDLELDPILVERLTTLFTPDVVHGARKDESGMDAMRAGLESQ